MINSTLVAVFDRLKHLKHEQACLCFTDGAGEQDVILQGPAGFRVLHNESEAALVLQPLV